MIAMAGITLVPGIAAGEAFVIETGQVDGGPLDDARDAREQFAAARNAAEAGLRTRIATLPDGPARDILCAHLALIADPILLAAVAAHMDAGLGVGAAIASARSELVARFEALRDPVLRARAADLSDVCGYLTRYFHRRQDTLNGARGHVVCAAELSPAQVVELAAEPPLAFVLESRADTSHAAILLRALGVPAVIGVERIASVVRNGQRLLVDAARNRVILDPSEEDEIDISMAAAAESDQSRARTQDGILG